MNAQDLIREQPESAHGFLEQTLADCSAETLAYQGEGWAINPILPIYANIALTEDSIINGMVQGKPPLLVSAGWGEKLGIEDANPSQTPEWAGKQLDVALVRDYAKAVSAATDEFLANAGDDVLLATQQTPMGEMSRLQMIANVGVIHLSSHWGEIAAIKGFQGLQGLKGMPF